MEEGRKGEGKKERGEGGGEERRKEEQKERRKEGEKERRKERYNERSVDNRTNGINNLPNKWIHHNTQIHFGKNYSELTEEEQIKANGWLEKAYQKIKGELPFQIQGQFPDSIVRSNRNGY